MSTHAARLLKPGGHPPVTPDGHGITFDGVAMHSGLPQGLSDGSGNQLQAIDSRRFRSVLGHFATGVVAITAIDPDKGGPCGLAANSFTSVSLDPPLVAFCVAHTSTSWPRLRAAKTLTVNVLAEHQQPICAALASKGGDKFAGLDWSHSPGGNPVIDGALAWIDCSVEAEHPAGDHVIVVARVHDLGVHGDGGPLLFFRGGYGRFHA
ncbi:flavin reductase family protein [Streptosporangium sp. NPDC000396]|uniref:flavin reductase family protein n=1 Tax=Streptosporangium sp. NPDC000396 TaxID=3366185 RepID=UPI0036AB1197